MDIARPAAVDAGKSSAGNAVGPGQPAGEPEDAGSGGDLLPYGCGRGGWVSSLLRRHLRPRQEPKCCAGQRAAIPRVTDRYGRARYAPFCPRISATSVGREFRVSVGQLPAADAPDVDVDEVGLGVVSDPAALHGERGIAHLGGGNAGYADVDGLGFHVLAVLGDSVAVLAEVGVAPRGAVSADNVDHAVRVAKAGHQIMEEVELLDVVILHVAGAVVAQEVIELGNGFGQITVADAVDDVDVLAGMQVVEMQTVGGSRSVGGERSASGKERQENCSENGLPKRHDAVKPRWGYLSAGRTGSV